METLNAISPIDGRYRRQAEKLADYFSEAALIKYRVKVEVEYFIALCRLPLPQLNDVDPSTFETMRNIYRNFSLEDAKEVKEIEKTTNHDVKAVEYFLKRHFDALGLSKHKEFIHFGLTSQDINNTSVPMSLKDCHNEVLLPMLKEVTDILASKAEKWRQIPMLAHTHGQPASPTLLGKEMQVFVYRLQQQLSYFDTIPFSAKFGGATGNFNAHNIAFPQYDWVDFANRFCDSLGLKRSLYTTQIENYDNLAAYFDNLRRLNVILMDFCRDMWQYISMEYFKQKIKEGEVGSSAMPHKVNPIDFENSEGNLGIANAVLQFLAMKLPVSRLQRDLTDSTVLRNVGVPFGHGMIAMQSTLKGLRKLILHEEKIEEDLNNTWAVVAEAIQTILRREAYPHPYEALKALTRTNKKMSEETIHEFVQTLNVSDAVKAELMAITPHNYTGI